MTNRVLHFMSEDADSGDEYVVFLEDGDDSEIEDHRIRGYRLCAEGEYELYGKVEGGFPFGEMLQKVR